MAALPGRPGPALLCFRERGAAGRGGADSPRDGARPFRGTTRTTRASPGRGGCGNGGPAGRQIQTLRVRPGRGGHHAKVFVMGVVCIVGYVRRVRVTRANLHSGLEERRICGLTGYEIRLLCGGRQQIHPCCVHMLCCSVAGWVSPAARAKVSVERAGPPVYTEGPRSVRPRAPRSYLVHWAASRNECSALGERNRKNLSKQTARTGVPCGLLWRVGIRESRRREATGVLSGRSPRLGTRGRLPLEREDLLQTCQNNV